MSLYELAEEVLREFFGYAIIAVELCGAFVIMVGVVRGVIGYIRCYTFNYKPEEIPHLRRVLGRSMVLALEFQVAADILKTGLSPTWQDILLLAAIIAVRTVLSFLMERELEFLSEGHQEAVARRE
ncbi:MAG: DUF1622 domain-containing protein, partial [Anaerolineae bacterium]|nr:DUF1622 domain-containing protein [Anaerolineae bacterium]